ncbi:mRNA-capping enzyme [Agrilus planipennis]|uniref:mRNA-capping enzyme n=1 Tax=Agrilus planipennis TaxID=224129 RepID=A0A1W4X0Q2_AGRPL|nr:mRNA-capping enzyme [Agrilus planipennis]
MSKYKDSSGAGIIPNRWLHCPRKASDLIVNKFIAFKTPLSSRYDDQVPAECRFPPKMLFDLCRAKRIKIGLWIDLTNTKRFYNKQEVEEHDCRYLKMQCRGHGETPSEEQTAFFIKMVHNFILQKPLECIAVHCTHGFNRTGFLIVSYLVEKMDLGVEVALEMFANVRPPGIYKEDYIRELYRRYEDDNAPPAPPLPDWYFDDNEAGNSSDSQSYRNEESPESSNSSNCDKQSNNLRRNRRNMKAPIFMKGVPGVIPFLEQPKASQLQDKVQVMCEWKGNGFPGCQPVSMSVENINLLHQKPYRVSWKADGTRYMLLIHKENEIYFFDRDHNVFKVTGLTFPHKKNLNIHLKDTLLDGEMVIDKVDGQDIPRYLAYDIVKFEGKDVGKMAFSTVRMECIQKEIINPRIAAMEKGLINKASEPFSVRKKEFWHITQAASLLGEKFAKNLSHEPDGLIFQPAKEPYVAGRCDEVLKWKPQDLNSVDFRLRIVEESGAGIVPRKVCQLYVGQLNAPFSTMKYTKQLKDLDGKIVECKYENDQWKFMRERTDKSFPNSYTTAMAVYHSIRNPVTKEKLLDFIERYRFDDDCDLMPPPPKRICR